MPTAPTGQDPSYRHPELGDQEAPARRSSFRTTRDTSRSDPSQKRKARETPSEPVGKGY